jgi:hypothetical protein
MRNALSKYKQYSFCVTLFRGYPWLQEIFPKCLDKDPPKKEEEEKKDDCEKKDDDDPCAKKDDDKPPTRRGFPAPFGAPFPATEWQATPVPGNPITAEEDQYPLTQALWAVSPFMKDNRIRIYGWINGSTNWSTNKYTNQPNSYWFIANRLELDQFVLKVEREVDSVQTDHIDYGFRSVALYGQDYRFTTAGGWGIEQLTKHNALYGWDPIEQYLDIYVPKIFDGLIFRIGRWVACPDIETQLAPDNYMGSHSLLFTYDTYTQTGFEVTVALNKQWLVQAGLNCGDDMAPWYQGAIPCGFFGLRWISKNNKDSIYTCLNQINDAKFQQFNLNGLPAGHDNYNYVVSTWQHKFCDRFFTKTEGYYMWEKDAYEAGTVSVGPAKPQGGGGGAGTFLPGTAHTYGGVNYTCVGLTKKDFITFRNEVWDDADGLRSGFPGVYVSSSIGLSHNFTNNLQIRPEVGYYRNLTGLSYNVNENVNTTGPSAPNAHGAWIAGMDFTLRF